MPTIVKSVGTIMNSNIKIVKKTSSKGVCDTCGSPTGTLQLYQFGYGFPEGNSWTGGEFCSKDCWLHRPNRLRDAKMIGDRRRKLIKNKRKEK